MKTSNLLLLGALGVGAYLLFSKKVGANTENNNGVFGPGVDNGTYTLPMPDSSSSGTQDMRAAQTYANAVSKFNKTQTVQAGVDVINAGYPSGSLPRLSQTIVQGIAGSNTNVARLADGSIAKVSVINAKTTATPSGYIAQPNVIPTGKTPDGFKRWF